MLTKFIKQQEDKGKERERERVNERSEFISDNWFTCDRQDNSR